MTEYEDDPDAIIDPRIRSHVAAVVSARADKATKISGDPTDRCAYFRGLQAAATQIGRHSKASDEMLIGQGTTMTPLGQVTDGAPERHQKLGRRILSALTAIMDQPGSTEDSAHEDLNGQEQSIAGFSEVVDALSRFNVRSVRLLENGAACCEYMTKSDFNNLPLVQDAAKIGSEPATAMRLFCLLTGVRRWCDVNDVSLQSFINIAQRCPTSIGRSPSHWSYAISHGIAEVAPTGKRLGYLQVKKHVRLIKKALETRSDEISSKGDLAKFALRFNNGELLPTDDEVKAINNWNWYECFLIIIDKGEIVRGIEIAAKRTSSKISSAVSDADLPETIALELKKRLLSSISRISPFHLGAPLEYIFLAVGNAILTGEKNCFFAIRENEKLVGWRSLDPVINHPIVRDVASFLRKLDTSKYLAVSTRM